jgi:c-di-GMP-related signal transduction protein
VGRQPIYDRAGDVVAYELLFRDAVDATSASRRSAQATSQVIVSAFTEFGLDQLVGTRACFINVTREFLVGELPIPFDSNQAVLEIVETVEVDDAVIEGVNNLIERGFTIALDDFTPGAHERLLNVATYVKIDMMDVEPDVVYECIQLCRQHPQIQLVAERLETEDDLQRAFALGFDFFQGHVLGRPSSRP